MTVKKGRVFVFPSPPTKHGLPAEIAAAYPRFIDILEQARRALMIGLPDLAGMGMRKAFEYLVKEHAVGFYGRARDDVAKEPLGQTVNKIDDTDLLRWATAAKNLGNDEVHWEKKHVDKGAVELDKLIVVVAKAFASKIADRALLNEIEATEAAHKQPHNP